MYIKDDSAIKIERIRKSIFNDILQYNKDAAQNKRTHDKTIRQKELQDFSDMNRKQQSVLHQEDEMKRRSMQMQRDQLKKQYDRQINEKRRKQQQERQHDRIYADLAISYQQYENQRRLYDLERMYNRKKYQAKIVDSQPRRLKTEMDHLDHYEQSGTPQIKSKRQVTFANESPNIDQHDTPVQQNRLNHQGRNHKYNDSLDNIQFQDNPEYSTPHRYSKPEEYDNFQGR